MSLDWSCVSVDSVLLALAIVIVGAFLAQLAFSSSLPPGNPWALPYLGDAIEMATTNPIKFYWTRYKKYGSVFKLSTPGGVMYVVADPQAFRQVMKHDNAEAFVPKGFQALIGSIDHIVDVEEHLIWRKYFTAAVGPAGIDKLLPEMQKVVDRHLGDWEAAGKFPLMAAMNKVALDFGVDIVAGLDLPQDVDVEWTKARVMEFINGLFTLPIDLPGTDLHKALVAKRLLKEKFLPVCTSRVDAILSKGNDGAIAEAGSINMLEAQILPSKEFRDINADLLFDRVMGNYVASVDTTRNMLWTVMGLCSLSPQVMRKLREEQDKVVQEVGLELDYSALQSMSYMDATIREAMRIMPASNGSLRKLKVPVQVGKYTLPKDSIVMWTTWLNHALDPALYDGNTSCDIPPHMDWLHNLEHAFQPERWLEGSDGKPKMFSTFGYGAHLCLGMNLAIAEVKLVFASVLRRFEYRFVDSDFLTNCTFFPGPRPKPGQDLVVMTPVRPATVS